MTLVPGTRLGVYEISALLGEGGPPPLAQHLARASASLAEAQPEPRP